MMNWHFTERRRHARKSCFIAVDYTINDRLHKDFIQNISAGGVLIGTRRDFLVGKGLVMSFQLPKTLKPINITGEIAWASRLGIGVKFKLGEFKFTAPKGLEPDFYDLETGQENSIGGEEEVRKMGRIKKRRVRWQPSASLDVTNYKLYWSQHGEVNYNSSHAELGNVTEVILPENVPSFPLDTGDLELGVTAINQAGNESDMTKLTVHFNFTVPDAPQNLEVEEI